MNTKTLSNRALSVIDQYQNFRIGQAVCSVPYYNNRVHRTRAGLRAKIGKGSPKEIYEEIRDVLTRYHIQTDTIDNQSLKKMLTDNNIGIDCSAFAYYVLNAELEDKNMGSLDKHISFTNCHGLFGKIRCALRPVENCNVSTFANNKNSRVISITEAQPGDIITMTADSNSSDFKNSGNPYDHILIIHQIEYQNFIPYKIHYSHAIAYAEDGLYGTGVKQGQILIIDSTQKITKQEWLEDQKTNDNNRLFLRAQKSVTELRRLN